MPSENLTTDAGKIASGSSLCQMQTTDKTTVNANEAQDKIFLDALETNGDAKNSNSIITSATQILKEGEHQWLNSEVIIINNRYKCTQCVIFVWKINADKMNFKIEF